jgi:hypothetical protein
MSSIPGSQQKAPHALHRSAGGRRTRIRRRAFIEQIVLSLDAAAEDFSEDEMSDQRTSVVKPRSRGIVK